MSKNKELKITFHNPNNEKDSRLIAEIFISHAAQKIVWDCVINQNKIIESEEHLNDRPNEEKIKMLFPTVQSQLNNYRPRLQHSDCEDGEYNCCNLQFVWGVKSPDDISAQEATFYTMNDLDIIYDRESNEYLLGIETIYSFSEGSKGEIKYLENLLERFTEFMEENRYISTEDKLCLYRIESVEPWRAETILDLYIRFKVFVNGYKSVFRS